MVVFASWAEIFITIQTLKFGFFFHTIVFARCTRVQKYFIWPQLIWPSRVNRSHDRNSAKYDFNIISKDIDTKHGIQSCFLIFLSFIWTETNIVKWISEIPSPERLELISSVRWPLQSVFQDPLKLNKKFYPNTDLLHLWPYQVFSFSVYVIRNMNRLMTKPTQWHVRPAKTRIEDSDQSTWRKLTHWADAQADLSLRWAHSHIVGFVMRRLIRDKDLLRWGKLFVNKLSWRFVSSCMIFFSSFSKQSYMYSIFQCRAVVVVTLRFYFIP